MAEAALPEEGSPEALNELLNEFIRRLRAHFKVVVEKEDKDKVVGYVIVAVTAVLGALLAVLPRTKGRGDLAEAMFGVALKLLGRK